MPHALHPSSTTSPHLTSERCSPTEGSWTYVSLPHAPPHAAPRHHPHGPRAPARPGGRGRAGPSSRGAKFSLLLDIFIIN